MRGRTPPCQTPRCFERTAYFHPLGIGKFDLAPQLTTDQCDIVLHFLHRYATWCIRTRRVAATQGARTLYRQIAEAMVQLDEQPSPSWRDCIGLNDDRYGRR